MFRSRFSPWLTGIGFLAAVEGLTVLAAALSFTAPAQAQFTDQRYPFLRRQHQRSGGGGFLQDLFGGFERSPERSGQRRRQSQPQQHVDYSRAPPPRKPGPNAPPPTTTIVVMGDGMADWLAYGLEDAFADSPEVAIVRQNKPRSGLIRYAWHSDLDWWHVARDDLAQEKANYVVMMLGLSDRQNISEKDVAKQAEKDRKATDQKAKDQKSPDQKAKDQNQADNPDQSLIAAPQRKYPHGVIPFRSDRWAAIYSHRIDETIAALKSKGVPVFWVGLPSIRGTRSTANAVYLNDLYRARAERAGAVYIDVWDGFVDENGKYSSYGPDYEGQTRRLRTPDGVFFTKYGARKLAHYVEHEIRHYMINRVVALPTGPIGPLPGAGKSAVRPLAGPVLPLTVAAPVNAAELAGAPGMRFSAGDAIATKVLVKGDAVAAPPGRADDFTWPPGSDANKPAPQAAAPAAAVANAAPTATAPAPAVVAPPPVAKKPIEGKRPAEAKRAPAPVETKLVPTGSRPKPTSGVAKVISIAPTELKPGSKPGSKPEPKPAPEEAKVEPTLPAQAKKPARKRSERTAETRTQQRLVPPAPVGRRTTHHSTRHRTPSLFGPDGLFGWLQH